MQIKQLSELSSHHRRAVIKQVLIHLAFRRFQRRTQIFSLVQQELLPAEPSHQASLYETGSFGGLELVSQAKLASYRDL